MAQNMTASHGRHTTHSISIRQDQEDTRRLLSIPSTQYRGGDGAYVGVLYIESVTEGDKQRGDTLNPGRKKY